MRSKLLTTLTGAALASAWAVCPAHATLYASDGFEIGANDYSAGTSMDSADGQAGSGVGPTGITGDWAVEFNGGGVGAKVNLRTTASGLDFGDHDTGSGAVESFRDGTSSAATSLVVYGSNFTGTAPQVDSTSSVYFSVLVNYTAGFSAGVGLEFVNTNRDPFGVGVTGDGEAGVWGGDGSSDFSSTTSGLGLTAGTTYLLVGKLEGNALATTAADAISVVGVYESGSVPASEGAALLTDNTQDVYFSAVAAGGNTQGQTLQTAYIGIEKSTGGSVGSIDELRVGSSFEDVVPTSTIPEPASLALMGLGGVMLLGRGRRSA